MILLCFKKYRYLTSSFERPDFKRMIADMEKGEIGTVITKDLSRLGRDYLKTGTYIEIIFPQNDVRYIAVNDGVDSEKGCNEFIGIRNYFNDFFAADTSKKSGQSKEQRQSVVKG